MRTFADASYFESCVLYWKEYLKMMPQVIIKVTCHTVGGCFCGSFAISNDIMSSLVSGKYLQGINLSIQENHYWPSGLKTATEKLTSCQTFTQYDIFLLLIYQLQYSLLSHTALKERQVNLHVEGRFFMPPLPLFTQKRKDNVTNNTLKMAWRQQMCILFSRQSISLFLRSTFKCQWVHLSFTCLYSELFPSYMVL